MFNYVHCSIPQPCTPLILQVALSKDPAEEVDASGPMGIIPAGTMLKTEFGVIIPDRQTQEGVAVSGWGVGCFM